MASPRANTPSVVPSLGAVVEDEVRRPQAAGAGHVLDDDVGIARQMLAEMAREVARIDVVGRARRIADHHGDGLLRLPAEQARADAIRAVTAVAFFMANLVGRLTPYPVLSSKGTQVPAGQGSAGFRRGNSPARFESWAATQVAGCCEQLLSYHAANPASRGCPEQPLPGDTAMKKLTLETTQPFQGLPEIVAYEEGLFEKEGLQIEWADRNKGAKYEARRDEHHHAQRARPVPEPRQDARGRQGRHVQCLRMGQLLPRRGDQQGQPAGRAPRHHHLRGDRRRPEVHDLYAAAARQCPGRRAILFRDPLCRAAPARRLPAA